MNLEIEKRADAMNTTSSILFGVGLVSWIFLSGLIGLPILVCSAILGSRAAKLKRSVQD